MSAIKKQSKLRWQHRNEMTACGRFIIETIWTAKTGRFLMQITNCPGTKVLNWEITKQSDESWRIMGEEERAEFTLGTLKDYVEKKAQDLGLRADREEAEQKELQALHCSR